MRIRILFTLPVACVSFGLGAAIVAQGLGMEGNGAGLVRSVGDSLGALLPFGQTWWGAVMVVLGAGGVLAAFPKSVASKSSDDWRAPASWRSSPPRAQKASHA